MLVGPWEFVGEAFDLFSELIDGLISGVVVDCGLVGDIGGFGGVGEGWDVFLDKEVVGADAGNHQTIAIASDRLLEDGSQFGVSVRHVSFLLLRFVAGRICENGDHLPESEEGLVDVDALFGLDTLCAGEADPFGAGQVYEFKLAGEDGVGIAPIEAFDTDGQDGVAPGALDVQLVGCTDPVFQSQAKILLEVLLVGAFENVKVLDAELLVFVPPEP